MLRQFVDLLSAPLINGEYLCLFVVQQEKWETEIFFGEANSLLSLTAHLLKKLSVLAIKPLRRCPQILQQCRLRNKNFSTFALTRSYMW